MNTIKMSKLTTRNGLAVRICLFKLWGQPYKRTMRLNGVAASGGAGGNCGSITGNSIK